MDRERTFSPVIFFDLLGTLVEQTPEGFRTRPEAEAWLRLPYRLGVLSNVGRGRRARDVQRILEEAGIYHRFAPELVVVASDLPCPLPDRRAFAVAAALAETPIGQCVFVSADPLLLMSGAAAGMKVVSVSAGGQQVDAVAISPPPGVQSALASGGTLAAASTPVLAAGEIDEDAGPTFVLLGRVVTMNSSNDVRPQQQVVVSRGKIAAIVPAGDPLPQQFSTAPVIDTNGTIYPGLMDLHNHFAYNVMPLWQVPKQFDNRTQWPRRPEYPSQVTMPLKLLASFTFSSRAIVRYVEAKALIGGTTTGQGMRTRVNGGPKLYRGAMRNVEETDDERLPEASTLVPDLQNNPESIESFRRGLAKPGAYFYHLAEGVDEVARNTYLLLRSNDLLKSKLVGVHALGLQPQDLASLASHDVKVVWSPFSNLLLYGKTLDLRALIDSGVLFSIGCDWTPSGSKNLLQELKVARFEADRQGVTLTNRDLVSAVTTDAARLLGWQQHLGVIRRGAMADLLVLRGTNDDPYDQLVGATERDVRLVVVHGIARYGNWTLMKQLHTDPAQPLERWRLGTTHKAFNLNTPGSLLNDLSLDRATEILQEAMSDLPQFKANMERPGIQPAASSNDGQFFTIELDNEFLPVDDDSLLGPFMAARPVQMATTVELDSLHVDTPGYLDRIATQVNIEAELKEALRDAYTK